MAEIGVAIDVPRSGFDDALKRLSGLVTFDPSTLMEEIAALGESQTRRRIRDEKTAPDGTPWAPNRAGTSILLQSGDNLLVSVASYADGDTATWGASWEFAHIHQDGAVITPKTAAALHFKVGGKSVYAKRVTIPARPFVGLSAENRLEIEDLITDHFGRLMQGDRP